MPRVTRSNPDNTNATASASASGSGPKPARLVGVHRRAPPKKNKKRRVSADSEDDSSPEAEGDGGSDADSETGPHFVVEDLMDTVTPEEEALEKPSLDNFKSYLGRISLEGLRRRLASRDRTNARPSNAALAALLTAKSEFRKSIALIAWAAGLSEATAEKYTGMGPTTRAASGYNNFAGYSNAALELAAPVAGNSISFTGRNKELKVIYQALNEVEKTMFRHPYFEALIGLPAFDTGDSNRDVNAVQVLESKQYKLTAEEESLFRPIYDRLVSKKRVSSASGPVLVYLSLLIESLLL